MPEHVSSPQTREDGAGDKRKAIVEAARDIFSRRGYDATTIAEIAAAAGIAVGTVYLYFHNKREIYIDASLSWATEVVAELMKPEIFQLPIRQVPRAMIEKSFEISRKNNQYMSLLQIDIQSPRELEIQRRAEEITIEALNTFFIQCIARDNLLPFDTNMYARIIFGLVNHMLYDCFCLHTGANEENYRERTIEILERIFFGPPIYS